MNQKDPIPKESGSQKIFVDADKDLLLNHNLSIVQVKTSRPVCEETLKAASLSAVSLHDAGDSCQINVSVSACQTFLFLICKN